MIFAYFPFCLLCVTNIAAVQTLEVGKNNSICIVVSWKLLWLQTFEKYANFIQVIFKKMGDNDSDTV